MYGYVVPDKSKIKQEEFILFSAFYCGICKTLGRNFGQLPRYTTNYDITFFAALIFDQLNSDAEFVKERCAGNPFTEKPIIKQNPLLNRIADLNIIFSYYKLSDNVTDGEGGSKLKRRLFKKPFLKAKRREPVLDGIVKHNYERLAGIEKNKEKSVDIAADCFACLLRDCAQELLSEFACENTLGLIYNVGKFVYLADALDDITEDFKKNRYNPFLAAYDGYNTYKNREQYIKDNLAALQFALVSTVNRAIECFNGIKFNQSYGLLENIIYYGLRQKTTELLESKKKLKRPKI